VTADSTAFAEANAIHAAIKTKLVPMIALMETVYGKDARNFLHDHFVIKVGMQLNL
jgi:hypothetical protein